MADTLTITSPTAASVIYAGATFVVSGTCQGAPVTVSVAGAAVATLQPAAQTWSYTRTAPAAVGPLAIVVTDSTGGAASVQVNVLPLPVVSPDSVVNAVPGGTSRALVYPPTPTGNSYTVVCAAGASSGVIYKNGSPDTRTRNVTAIGKQGSNFFQVNTAGNYYELPDQVGPAATTGTWTGGSSTPIGPFAPAAPPVTPPVSGANFSVSGGRIFAPNGQAAFLRGLCVAPWGQPVLANVKAPATTPLTGSFPGIGIYMLYCFNDEGYSANTALYSGVINALTAAGIVVVMVSCNSAYTQSVPTGAALTAQSAAFAAYAALYKGNPYLWFSDSNEPGDAPGQPGSCAAQQVATYNAIRGAGNGNIILMSASVQSNTSLPAANYRSMKNIGWNIHYYPWMGISAAALASIPLESIGGTTSADGQIPGVIGECGPSTSGGDPVDGPGLPPFLMGLPAGYNLSNGGSGPLLCATAFWGVATAGTEDQVYPSNATSGALENPYGLQVAAWIAGKPIPSAMRQISRSSTRRFGASTAGGLLWKARHAKTNA